MEKPPCVTRAERLDIVDEVPDLIGLEGVGERWHRSAVEPCRQVLEEVAIGLAALEAGCAREVEGQDRITAGVGQSQSRRAVPVTFFSMTTPAIHLLEEIRSAPHAIR